ncbi:ArsR/SmtB family transcription factor [Paenibacillus sp. NPDC056579]|uniref:ArsR/SmtB family transcription factor n=1 Tax=unclassified Paenibacillus TaxID=185978 RepID=UPI001EF8434C|nr:metalloregulator ArsR/SmtB family transcription factor [Paenibacillus sp. H1-7]ULL18891.1 ArsR family transcriptional regulator [Paenibacillus sp. H1-7]
MEDPIQEMAELFKLLGDKTRLTIVGLLKDRELCVCDIVDHVGISQPGVSQHLRKLKAGGLVNENRKGQWIYYSLKVEDNPPFREVLNQIPSIHGEFSSSNRCC